MIHFLSISNEKQILDYHSISSYSQEQVQLKIALIYLKLNQQHVKTVFTLKETTAIWDKVNR